MHVQWLCKFLKGSSSPYSSILREAAVVSGTSQTVVWLVCILNLWSNVVSCVVCVCCMYGWVRFLFGCWRSLMSFLRFLMIFWCRELMKAMVTPLFICSVSFSLFFSLHLSLPLSFSIHPSLPPHRTPWNSWLPCSRDVEAISEPWRAWLWQGDWHVSDKSLRLMLQGCCCCCLSEKNIQLLFFAISQVGVWCHHVHIVSAVCVIALYNNTIVVQILCSIYAALNAMLLLLSVCVCDHIMSTVLSIMFLGWWGSPHSGTGNSLWCCGVSWMASMSLWVQSGTISRSKPRT